MIIAITAISTALTVFWLVMLGRATAEDWIAVAYNKVYDNMTTIEKLSQKDSLRREMRLRHRGLAGVVAKLLDSGDYEKKIKKLSQKNEILQDGDIRKVNIFVAPGYVISREYEAIGKSHIHKTLIIECYELYGKKHAGYKAKHLLAKLLSYPIIGIAATLALGAVFMGAGNTTAGNAVLLIGASLVLILTYAMYDELREKVRKRREAIVKQFPNVVSKLALLVTSGMIMDRAWKETAYSQELELFREMQKTSEELDNLVSPEAAYSNFISRCNTKETARLASAIIQNLSKGNVEIGRLLKDMAREAWQERRHTARRDAEKANSKLMIPTMLLFLAILVMLMVPIAMNFTGL